MADGLKDLYRAFVIPQLSLLLRSTSLYQRHLSVLEIGPGPETILERLPLHFRHSIQEYTAFEPNHVFATQLRDQSTSGRTLASMFPSLKFSPAIIGEPFLEDTRIPALDGSAKKFDVVLFCHSLYGCDRKVERIRSAIGLVAPDGLVVVFHRDAVLKLDGLLCDHTASMVDGTLRVSDEDETLDHLASFVLGSKPSVASGPAELTSRRAICRSIGSRSDADDGKLLFQCPTVMLAFSKSANVLPELISKVPTVDHSTIKNWECGEAIPAAIVKPGNIEQVQQCVKWALRNKLGLTVLSGGHGANSRRTAVVCVDLGAFNDIHIVRHEACTGQTERLAIAGTGCNAEDIIRATMAVGLTVPLGSRPSVGAGLWLQGGIGHLARLYGLACDAIVGAVLVALDSGDVLYVPESFRPRHARRADDDSNLLWALRGAGTNFGIVVGVAFRTYPAVSHSLHTWTIPLRSDNPEAFANLSEILRTAHHSAARQSTDVFLFWNGEHVSSAIMLFDASEHAFPHASASESLTRLLGQPKITGEHTALELFDAEWYMSRAAGGHGSVKTDSFKRCLFLKDASSLTTIRHLSDAIEKRPSDMSYIHLLQGGGAVSSLAGDDTAFGCRDWDFACVVTGVWAREPGGCMARSTAVSWTYDVVHDLLPGSSGVYGADLGPTMRDMTLARTAFGVHTARLHQFKRKLDPNNVLAFACPLPKVSPRQRLVVLVTGESWAGKDHCAAVWSRQLSAGGRHTVRVISISEETKRKYSLATGADLGRLMGDRIYKELHRPALAAYFKQQLQEMPSLRADNFLRSVRSCGDADIVFVTGMRDQAPVANFSYLVPDRKVIEIRVGSSLDARKGRQDVASALTRQRTELGRAFGEDCSNWMTEDYRPDLHFINIEDGLTAIEDFAESHISEILCEDIQHLASQVHETRDFPQSDVRFRHVLGIAQQQHGLTICTELFASLFRTKFDVVACCEAGGFVFGSALAIRLGCSLALIRQDGKLPPPVVSMHKSPSHISSLSRRHDSQALQMNLEIIPEDASVLVVDDLLATGTTLHSILRLLQDAGIDSNRTQVAVVGELPCHRGRKLLHKVGFGAVAIKSLLVFDGV